MIYEDLTNYDKLVWIFGLIFSDYTQAKDKMSQLLRDIGFEILRQEIIKLLENLKDDDDFDKEMMEKIKNFMVASKIIPEIFE